MPLALPPREQWTPGVEFDEEHRDNQEEVQHNLVGTALR